jgi:hypothetical protein
VDHPKAVGDRSTLAAMLALRVDVARNGQQRGIRHASKYEIARVHVSTNAPFTAAPSLSSRYSSAA